MNTVVKQVVALFTVNFTHAAFNTKKYILSLGSGNVSHFKMNVTVHYLQETHKKSLNTWPLLFFAELTEQRPRTQKKK